MKTNQTAAMVGAFVADALSLGVHWVYNTGVIDKKFGRVEQYHDPMTSYHKGKQAGDFTHYGDQTLLLLESVSSRGGFNATDFAEDWRSLFTDYGGYVDKASQSTLDNMAAGNPLTESGSDSDDLAGASRMAALVPFYGDNLDQLVQLSRAQTAITHNNQVVIESADFFARTVFGVLAGLSPMAAMQDTLKAHFSESTIASLVSMGLESQQRDTRETIAKFGQMCSVEAGLPSAVHLIARYGDDFKSAMVENVMAGGDSSARGMMTGMILGAFLGTASIPDSWQTEMNANERIRLLLNRP